MSTDPIDSPVQPEQEPATGHEPAGESTDMPRLDAWSSDAMVCEASMDAHSDQPTTQGAGDTLEQSPAETAQAPAPPTVTPPLPDTRVRGKVTRLTPERVFVMLEDGRQGFVQMIEFAAQPIPREGDEISVIPEGVDAASGLLLLSKRQADELSFWQAVKPGDELEGVVTGMNKGGLDVDIGGARAFLPASQVDIHRIRDISMLIGEHVRCIVTHVDRTTHDLVLSRRKAQEKERKQARARALEALVEGQKYTGTVSSIADYGAFIDLGDIEGLLHINDMSWSHLRHPSQVVQPGQKIEVLVTKVHRESGKVSLGLKQLQPDPWANIEQKYPVDKRIKARVARLADFGAFLELEPGVDGLIPLSEMSWSRRITHPSEVLKVGDEPEVVVLKVDAAKRRISLGLKQTQPDPWTTVKERFPVDAKVTGKVLSTTDFGAFVELVPGVEGLIHISELSDKRVNAVTDVVQVGQQVEVRVLKVDTEAQRISLSMRTDRRATRPGQAEAPPDKAKKKPKKQLRGGLAAHFQWW